MAACGSSDSPAPGNTTPTNTEQPDSGATTTPSEPIDSGTPDTTPPVDHGAPSTTYPAFVPDIGELVDNGGPKLTTPKIVTVTWPGEPNADYFESFGDGIGKTDYWKAMMGEYGIGQASSDATMHVRMTKTLDTLVDTDIDSYVEANLTNATVGNIAPDGAKWPASDENTLYVLYIPTATKFSISQGGQTQDVCQSNVGGYHTETADGKYVYAVIPQCQRTGIAIKDDATESSSHEIAEATLDPHPQSSLPDGGTNAGWVGVDDAHWAWTQFQQFNVENGDLCEFERDSFYELKETGFDYFVQRQWSNKGAKAGHSPCQPQDPATPYFNTTLLSPQQVSLDLSALGGTKETANGVVATIGQTITFEVGFFSDGQTDPWTIQVIEGNPYIPPTTPRLTNMTVDKTTGVNGEKAQVSVTVTGLGRIKTAVATVVSSKGGALCDSTHPKEVCHYSPILIGTAP